MDGNGRWAKKRGLDPIEGHKQGGRTTEEIALIAKEVGVKYLTLYTFSTENWRRSPVWIAEFMKELGYYLENQTDIFMRERIRARFIGDRSGFSKKLQSLLTNLEEETKHFDTLHVNFALGYGARQEIAYAMRRIAEDVQKGHIKVNDIHPHMIHTYLYTRGMPDPDILIRPSGEMRVSNYLLWQIAYTELYFTDTLWPDFSSDEFLRIIEHYTKRERCYGRDRQAA